MTTAAPLEIAPLPENRDEWPPAAYGAGAPPEAYASYTKLRSGEWGLRVPGGIKPGQLVVARTRSGTERTERVRYVLWTGPDSRTGLTISLATIDTGRPAPVRSQDFSRPAPQPTRTAPQASTRKPTVRGKRQAMLRIAAPTPAQQWRGVTPDAPTLRATLDADRADAEISVN